jgi:hypothetical protein
MRNTRKQGKFWKNYDVMCIKVKKNLFLSVAKYGSAWHVARTQIVSSYRAFSREKIVAELGAYIGLGHVNVTLRSKFIFGFTYGDRA